MILNKIMFFPEASYKNVPKISLLLIQLITQDPFDHPDGGAADLPVIFLQDLVFTHTGFHVVDDIKSLAEEFGVRGLIVQQPSHGLDGGLADTAFMQFHVLLYGTARLD